MSQFVYTENDPKLTPEELNTLFKDVEWHRTIERSAEKTREMLERSPFYVTARLSGSLVGFGRLFADPYVAIVLDVVTHHDVRQHGIASEIMERIMAHSKGRYPALMTIDGSGIVGFYESFGFRPADPESDRLMYRSLKD